MDISRLRQGDSQKEVSSKIWWTSYTQSRGASSKTFSTSLISRMRKRLKILSVSGEGDYRFGKSYRARSMKASVSTEFFIARRSSTELSLPRAKEDREKTKDSTESANDWEYWGK